MILGFSMTQKGVTSVTSSDALLPSSEFDHHMLRQRRLSCHVFLDNQVEDQWMSLSGSSPHAARFRHDLVAWHLSTSVDRVF